MTREERQARIAELRRWIQEQDSEFRDEGFPPDVQEAWNKNDAELREHEKIMRELEERDLRIQALAKNDDNVESGADFRSRGSSVQLISRMTEREVFDLSDIRSNPLNPGNATREIRDRALRANELSHYEQPYTSQEGAKAHVEGLIRRNDDEGSWESDAIARRILLTSSPDYKRAFGKLVMANIRGQAGMAVLTPQEMRAVEAVRANLVVGTGGQGGFAVPATLDATVIPVSNGTVNPYRAVCRQEQITGLTWNGLTSAGGSTGATYDTEASVATDAAVTFLQPTMNMVRCSAFVPVSIELTQDWGGLGPSLARLIADMKDDVEAAKFATGTGTNEPYGMVTGATTTVALTTNPTFAIADLFKTEEALPPRFRPRAVWFGNRSVFNKARQFDTSGGSGVWVDGLQPGLLAQFGTAPAGADLGPRLIGYRAFEASGMDGVIAAGAHKFLILGDPNLYLIVDRIGMDIELIPHLFSNAAAPGLPMGMRGFYAFWRNNAKVLAASGFRTLITT